MGSGWGYVGRQLESGRGAVRAGAGRSYNRVLGRVARARRRRNGLVAVRPLADLPAGPVLRVNLSTGAPQRLLVLAGTHGDEPAGVEAALRLVESLPRPWLDHVSFTIVPCLNPSGYRDGRRGDRQGRDLNWSYDRADVPELAGLQRLVRDRGFAAVVDFHEDWESRGFYLYELVRPPSKPLGRAIVRDVASLLPINTAREIEGAPATGGVIRPQGPPDVLAGEGIPVRLFDEHTDHYLTTETPVTAPLGARADAHLAALARAVRPHTAAGHVFSKASAGG